MLGDGRLLPVVLLLVVAASRPAAAADPEVRVGVHSGFGRVVWEFAHVTGFRAERSGDIVTLHFDGAGDVPAAGGSTRNVVTVGGGPGTATVTLAPGARLRTSRLGNRVVLDAMDAERAARHPEPPPRPANPPRAAAKAGEADTAARNAAPALALPVVVTPGSAPLAAPLLAPVSASAVPAPVVAASIAPPATVALPAALAPIAPAPVGPEPAVAAPVPSLAVAAAPVPPTPGAGAGTTVLLPFDPRTGAAAFRRGAAAWLVFDQARPIDLDAVTRLPGFAGAVVQVLPQATVLRVPLADGMEPRLQPRPTGWAVTMGPIGPAAPPITPGVAGDQFTLRAPSPGSVVVVPDAETGGNLLVGTLRAEAAGTPVAYKVPGFTLLPSWQGIAVEPLSDRTALHDTPDGFTVSTGSPLSAAPDGAHALANAAYLTRRWDFTDEPVATLLRRLQGEVAGAGAAPAQSRLGPRRAAAQTMIALGLGAEAESLLRLAVTEDPRAAADPDTAGLTAIAALLAERPQEAAGLANTALDGSDEVALWRAVRAAEQSESAPDAAAVFAATAKLVLAYPDALRHRLLPLAAETMAQGGQGPAADALLAALPDDSRLTYARALRLEAKGDSGGALTVYDALAAGRDQKLSARAATRAALLRLATGALSPAAAAKVLERGFMDWRGDNRERDLRLRVAGLRAQAGQWREAFALLRETEPLYPDDAALIHDRMGAMLHELLTGPAAAAIPAMDMVALADENAEVVARAAPAETAALLAEKLAALDLPRRAAPILDRMMRAAPPGPAQAVLGEKLAALRLAEGDASGASAALAASAPPEASPDLPGDLVERRGLMSARAAALAGDTAGAVATLAAVGTAAADDQRATILAAAKDWRGEQAALNDLAAKTVAPSGPLTPVQQDVVLRLASAQSRSGDTGALRALAANVGTRLDGPRADMFRLLTAPPVGGVGDLRRSAGEVALARAVPASVAAIGTR